MFTPGRSLSWAARVKLQAVITTKALSEAVKSACYLEHGFYLAELG